MTGFESWKQYSAFSWYVMRKSRHILDAKNQRFLDVVVGTSQKRRETIKKGAVLGRAQLGHSWRTEIFRHEDGKGIDSIEVEAPFLPERMIPQPDRASEGRVNPKGIPCLYFSTDMEMAMTETRPWIGSLVSVAQFVILKDLSVVDCSADSARAGVIIEAKAGAVEGELEWGVKNSDPDEWENIVWGDINRPFSQPVTRTDDVAEYAPTQVLAEAFRNAGYDGIVYGSKLGTGKNVAIFGLTVAQLANCQLYRVEAVNLKFVWEAGPYYRNVNLEAAEKLGFRAGETKDVPLPEEGQQ